MPLDTAPSSFTTSDDSFFQRPSRSPLRWVSRRLSRPKTPLVASDTDDSEGFTQSYALYCRASSTPQRQSVHLNERQSFDFLPVGSYGFTQLESRLPSPPPRELTPQDPPRRPWWTRLLCGR